MHLLALGTREEDFDAMDREPSDSEPVYRDLTPEEQFAVMPTSRESFWIKLKTVALAGLISGALDGAFLASFPNLATWVNGVVGLGIAVISIIIAMRFRTRLLTRLGERKLALMGASPSK